MAEEMVEVFGSLIPKHLLDEARRRMAESIEYECPRGCCVHQVHPTEDHMSGVGPVGCPYGDDSRETVMKTWTRKERHEEQGQDQ